MAGGPFRFDETFPHIGIRYILSGVIMTLELVAQVVRPDYSVINVGIQYSSVRFECYYCAGFCYVREYVD